MEPDRSGTPSLLVAAEAGRLVEGPGRGASGIGHTKPDGGARVNVPMMVISPWTKGGGFGSASSSRR